MSDHNPSDSFDSHPENSGCSNDDFEQLEPPGNGFYHDNGDADGPDPFGSDDVYGYDPDEGAQVSTTTAGYHYDPADQGAEVSTTTTAGEDVYGYDPEEGGEVSTTTTTTGEEDEAEADRYGAGASEAEAYGYTPESLISFGDEDGEPFDLDPLQPSAPVPDITASDGQQRPSSVPDIMDFDSFDDRPYDQVQPSAPGRDIMEPAIAYASSKAADILSTIAPSASPPSGHHKDYDYEEPISSTIYEDDDDDDGYDFHATGHQQVHGAEADEPFLDEPTKVTSSYEQPTPQPVKYAEPVLCTSSTDDIQADRSPAVAGSEKTAKGSCLKNIDPREESYEEADVSSQQPFFKDLIYWRDVKKTGIVFGALLVVLVSLALMSIISVLAYLSLIALTGTFSFVIYKKVMSAVCKSNDGHPFNCLLDKDISLREDKLKGVIQTVLKNVNATVRELRHLFLIEDTVDSIKFGILLWALTYIGSWFSDLTLIIIVLVLVFSVPKLYETYQVQIDNYVGLAKAQINTYLSIILSKVPFLKKKEKTH